MVYIAVFVDSGSRRISTPLGRRSLHYSQSAAAVYMLGSVRVASAGRSGPVSARWVLHVV